LSEPINVLFDGDQFYVLQLPERRIVQIGKNMVKAMELDTNDSQYLH